MRKNRKFIKKTVISILFIIILLLAFLSADTNLRGLIDDYAASKGKTILINAANKSFSEVICENGITYDNIVTLSRNSENVVTSLEIDIVKINMLKSQISEKITENLEQRNNYKISIPTGTVIGSKYTVGRGPDIKFQMRLSSTVVTDFKSAFFSAGINQVLHQIIVTVKMEGFAVMPWYRSEFTCDTSFIAAQTVIVGVTPEAFTDVIDTEGDPVGDIFDYGAEIE